MKPTTVVVTSVLTTLAVIAFGVVGASAVLPQMASRTWLWRVAAMVGMEVAGIAHALGPHHTAFVEAHIAASLDLDETQSSALAPMIAVLESWRGDVVAACESFDPQSVGEGIEQMQAVLQLSAQSLGELRPAFDSFYTALNDEQRAHIDELLAHHRARHGK